MADKGKKIKTIEVQYGWCEAEESWLPMTECLGCIYHDDFDDTSHYCRWVRATAQRPSSTNKKLKG